MRFKNDDQGHRKRKRSKREESPSRSHEKKRHKKHKYYTPPKIYEEEDGWIPPSSSHNDDDEAEWREKLFNAMAEDEGQDAYAFQYDDYTYGSSSRSREDLMDEEEYRQYIVDGMYRKKNAESIAAEEALKKERKRQEKERRRAQKRVKQEQERQDAMLMQMLLRDARNRYNKKWEDIEKLSTINEKDIPWPVRGEFALSGVEEFLVDQTQSAEMNKKTVRKEQLRYHPDKFMHRVMRKFHGKEKEKERVISRMNEMSGWLNELWRKLNEVS